MQLLKDILYKTRIEEIIGSTNVPIENISFDSRTIKNNYLFIATKGEQVDGHQFILTATQNGAIAIVCEKLPETLQTNVTYIRVKNSTEALGIIASNFYNNPSDKIDRKSVV